PGDQKSAQFFFFRSFGLEPLSGEQSHNHGAERGNKTQRRPTALIKDKRILARKEVQEPNVEGPREVGVLVPMREKSGVEMMPVWWNSDPGVVHLRTWSGIQRESRPKANQDQHQRHNLR